MERSDDCRVHNKGAFFVWIFRLRASVDTACVCFKAVYGRNDPYIEFPKLAVNLVQQRQLKGGPLTKLALDLQESVIVEIQMTAIAA